MALLFSHIEITEGDSFRLIILVSLFIILFMIMIIITMTVMIIMVWFRFKVKIKFKMFGGFLVIEVGRSQIHDLFNKVVIVFTFKLLTLVFILSILFVNLISFYRIENNQILGRLFPVSKVVHEQIQVSTNTLLDENVENLSLRFIIHRVFHF